MFGVQRDPAARRGTAIHEGGHYIIGCLLSGTTVTARLRNDWDGYTQTRDWEGSDLDYAVYCLAGWAADRLIGRGPLDSPTDRRYARQALRGTGHRLRDADRIADRLVRTHHRQIVTASEVLYQRGRI